MFLFFLNDFGELSRAFLNHEENLNTLILYFLELFAIRYIELQSGFFIFGIFFLCLSYNRINKKIYKKTDTTENLVGTFFCFCVLQFGLSSIQVGFVFIIYGGTYALISPFIGQICDAGFDPKKMVILGTILTAISFSIVGPAPFVPLNK